MRLSIVIIAWLLGIYMTARFFSPSGMSAETVLSLLNANQVRAAVVFCTAMAFLVNGIFSRFPVRWVTVMIFSWMSLAAGGFHISGFADAVSSDAHGFMSLMQSFLPSLTGTFTAALLFGPANNDTELTTCISEYFTAFDTWGWIVRFAIALAVYPLLGMAVHDLVPNFLNGLITLPKEIAPLDKMAEAKMAVPMLLAVFPLFVVWRKANPLLAIATGMALCVMAGLSWQLQEWKWETVQTVMIIVHCNLFAWIAVFLIKPRVVLL